MKTTHFFSIILILFLFSSCGPTLYVPNTVNTPMLSQKGDWKASAGAVALGPEGNFEFQGSYAFSDKMAVMGSFFHGNDTERTIKHTLGELGLGIYKTYWPNKRGVNMGRVELFGGLSLGKGQDDNVLKSVVYPGPDETCDYLGKYYRLFLQPGLGFRTKVIDLSFHTRIAWINFHDILEVQDGILISRQQTDFSTIEPVVTLSFGYKHVKYYLQMGSTEPIGNPKEYFELTDKVWEGIHVNVGFAFSPWRAKTTSITESRK